MNTPSVVLTGYPPPDLVPPWQGTPPARVPPLLTWLGGYPTWVPPGRVPPWQGTPPGYPPVAPWHSGKCCKALWDMGTPPGCPMAFWEMLQSIMGYGQTDWWKDRRLSKHYLPVVLRMRAVIILPITRNYRFRCISAVATIRYVTLNISWAVLTYGNVRNNYDERLFRFSGCWIWLIWWLFTKLFLIFTLWTKCTLNSPTQIWTICETTIVHSDIYYFRSLNGT